jgi:2-polyprenyl-6-methoxyphenol hydroxylase-like FAD-dependent oxidoreductase
LPVRRWHSGGELEILRGDLANVLYEASRQDTEYIFDDSITAMKQDGTGVEVSFGNREPRRFDLVVGADGLHSNVRSLVFGDESAFMRHLGIYFAIFTIPNYMNLKDMAGLYYGTLGKRMGIFSASSRKRTGTIFRHLPGMKNKCAAS